AADKTAPCGRAPPRADSSRREATSRGPRPNERAVLRRSGNGALTLFSGRYPRCAKRGKPRRPSSTGRASATVEHGARRTPGEVPFDAVAHGARVHRERAADRVDRAIDVRVRVRIAHDQGRHDDAALDRLLQEERAKLLRRTPVRSARSEQEVARAPD